MPKLNKNLRLCKSFSRVTCYDDTAWQAMLILQNIARRFGFIVVPKQLPHI